MSRCIVLVMHARVDDCYCAFTKAIVGGGSVAIAPARDEMGQGRVPGADPAPAQNTGDGVATFDDVGRKIRRDAKSGPKRGTSRLARAQRALEITT